jgi:hypothetical protein
LKQPITLRKATSIVMDEDRAYYQTQTIYCCREARRAFAHAAKDLILNDRKSYVEWMDNAIDFLLEAEEFRAVAKTISWQRRQLAVLDTNPASLECDAATYNDKLSIGSLGILFIAAISFCIERVYNFFGLRS